MVDDVCVIVDEWVGGVDRTVRNKSVRTRIVKSIVSLVDSRISKAKNPRIGNDVR